MILAIVLDYGTSVAMVIAYGPSAEGSLVTREFYETKTLQSLTNLLVSQSGWIELTSFVAVAIIVTRWGLAKETKPLVSISLGGISVLGIAIGWLMGMARLAIGPASNLSAFFTVAYGQGVGQIAYGVMAIIAVIVVVFDFIRTSREVGSSPATLPS
jgi:hypothetical protein